ncbi:type II toxin-antitoxin system RelB/DinJ family antitoxin [Helicobacter cetorum]|uniref:RelB protein n=1 Tax=Helicobacter cetorum (strain ATCC BAA-540 / CCUG 52418 / MIT 99-5656) TaxID=1163745 RepID=I0ESC3_HELCM|nr:type II toxin-antitoxin system RelB/DinJ family antitoxin [Helicobacter cetorum]AFI05842.1 RelB protein [Helicobacter cetorum MIT 99-5656]
MYIPVDKMLENEVQLILESYGLTPSLATHLFFKEIIKTHKIPLSSDWQDGLLNAETLKAIQDLEKGENVVRSGVNDFKEWANWSND